MLDPAATGSRYSFRGETRHDEAAMRDAARRVKPDEYILAVLSPEERLDAALRVAREAFRGTTLTVGDVEAAVRRGGGRGDAPSGRKGKGRSLYPPPPVSLPLRRGSRAG